MGRDQGGAMASGEVGLRAELGVAGDAAIDDCAHDRALPEGELGGDRFRHPIGGCRRMGQRADARGMLAQTLDERTGAHALACTNSASWLRAARSTEKRRASRTPVSLMLASRAGDPAKASTAAAISS